MSRLDDNERRRIADTLLRLEGLINGLRLALEQDAPLGSDMGGAIAATAVTVAQQIAKADAYRFAMTARGEDEIVAAAAAEMARTIDGCAAKVREISITTFVGGEPFSSDDKLEAIEAYLRDIAAAGWALPTSHGLNKKVYR